MGVTPVTGRPRDAPSNVVESDCVNGWQFRVNVCVDELHGGKECVGGGLGREPRHGLNQAAPKILGGISRQETSARMIKPVAPGPS